MRNLVLILPFMIFYMNGTFAGGLSTFRCKWLFSNLDNEVSFLNEAEITQWKNEFKKKQSYSEIKDFVCKLKKTIDSNPKLRELEKILSGRFEKSKRNDFIFALGCAPSALTLVAILETEKANKVRREKEEKHEELSFYDLHNSNSWLSVPIMGMLSCMANSIVKDPMKAVYLSGMAVAGVNLWEEINLFGKNQVSITELKTVKTDVPDFVVGATTVLLHTLTIKSLSSVFGNYVINCR